MTNVRIPGLLAVLAVGSVGGSVFAADAPVGPFSVFLGQGFTYDSNVFRLGPAANAQQLIGDSNRSDWISTTRGGAIFETQQSLQRFRLSGELNYSKYNRFSQLDHTGRNLAALWDWKVGNRWFGEARAAQINNLTPFQDFRVSSANTQTSTTTVNDYFLSGNYWARPDWSIGAGVGRNSGRYSADVLKPAEYDANFGELAARYRPPTGSEVVATANFFQALHRLDAAGLDGIFAVRFPDRGLGRALNDRLSRAAFH